MKLFIADKVRAQPTRDPEDGVLIWFVVTDDSGAYGETDRVFLSAERAQSMQQILLIALSQLSPSKPS